MDLPKTRAYISSLPGVRPAYYGDRVSIPSDTVLWSPNEKLGAAICYEPLPTDPVSTDSVTNVSIIVLGKDHPLNLLFESGRLVRLDEVTQAMFEHFRARNKVLMQKGKIGNVDALAYSKRVSQPEDADAVHRAAYEFLATASSRHYEQFRDELKELQDAKLKEFLKTRDFMATIVDLVPH